MARIPPEDFTLFFIFFLKLFLPTYKLDSLLDLPIELFFVPASVPCCYSERVACGGSGFPLAI